LTPGLSEIERSEIARRHLESAEAWLRRIIDHQLTAAFGAQYWQAMTPPDTPVTPKRIREAAAQRREAEPLRYVREIDATTLDESIDLLLHPRLYRDNFRQLLIDAYPDGPEEARTFLSRLTEHRNRLAHGGACSARCLEQCACYSNDLIDSLKAFFREQNMERTFNVPTFTHITDNKGNKFDLKPKPDDQIQFVDVRATCNGDLYAGDELVVEVEVDESFSGYSIRWLTFNGDRGEGAIARLLIEPRHVGVQMDIRFEVVSGEQWHKLHGGCDDRVDLRYRVLPPN
jgi:hypothetical protein